jgi:hypothetical protein
MPDELDQLLTETLQERADLGAPIDPARMTQAAVVGGRRLRTRRRVVTTALAAVAVGAVAVTATLAPRHSDSARPAPDSSTSTMPAPGPLASAQASANLALLPMAAGQPGAKARPDLVATDPRIVHFSVDSLARNAFAATLTSTGDHESADIERNDFQVYVAVSRNPKALPPRDSFVKFNEAVLSSPMPVTIGGRPGTAAALIGTTRTMPPGLRSAFAGSGLRVLVWQPVDGLWATVEVTQKTQEQAIQIAESVRFDQAKKCAVPFTVGQPPTGSKLLTCRTRLDTQSTSVFADAQLIFGDGKKQINFGAMDARGGGDYARPLKAGPNHVWADPAGGNWTMLMDGVFFDVLASSHKAYTQTQALAALATVRMAAHPGNPSTW